MINQVIKNFIFSNKEKLKNSYISIEKESDSIFNVHFFDNGKEILKIRVSEKQPIPITVLIDNFLK